MSISPIKSRIEKTFRHSLYFFTTVDNFINIIPIDSTIICMFINKLTTGYPLSPVDNRTIVLAV
jgi:hypothetical protein